MIMKGKLALCSRGALGLITAEQPRNVLYKQCDNCRVSAELAYAGKITPASLATCTCETGLAYVGIHLTDKIAPVGSPWSSRTPHVVGSLERGIDEMSHEGRMAREDVRLFALRSEPNQV